MTDTTDDSDEMTEAEAEAETVPERVIDDSALRVMGLTLEEVLEIDRRIIANRKPYRDGRICICGHAMVRHDLEFSMMCNPSRMKCPCKKPRVVLVASDTRKFLRKTEGPGPEHALSRGIAALLTSGGTLEWVEPFACMAPDCTTPDAQVVVRCMTPRWQEIYGTRTAEDLFICSECLVRAREASVRAV